MEFRRRPACVCVLLEDPAGLPEVRRVGWYPLVELIPLRGPFLVGFLGVREVGRSFRGRPLLSGRGVSRRLGRRSPFFPFSLDLPRNFLAPLQVVR